MDEVKELSWDEFERTGKIEDYLKYKAEEFSDRESEPIGNP